MPDESESQRDIDLERMFSEALHASTKSSRIETNLRRTLSEARRIFGDIPSLGYHFRYRVFRRDQQKFQDTLTKSFFHLARSFVDLLEEFQDFRDSQNQTHREMREYMAVSMWGSQRDAKMHRYILVKAYLSTASPEQEEKLRIALSILASSCDFTVVDEFPPETGSWFQKFLWKSKQVLAQPEVSDRLKKLERAVELATLHKHQADVDKTESDAVAALIMALRDTPNAALQIGSILVLKLTPLDGQTQLVTRTLSQKEMAMLDENPQLLRDPSSVLSALSAQDKLVRPTRAITFDD